VFTQGPTTLQIQGNPEEVPSTWARKPGGETKGATNGWCPRVIA